MNSSYLPYLLRRASANWTSSFFILIEKKRRRRRKKEKQNETKYLVNKSCCRGLNSIEMQFWISKKIFYWLIECTNKMNWLPCTRPCSRSLSLYFSFFAEKKKAFFFIQWKIKNRFQLIPWRKNLFNKRKHRYWHLSMTM